MAGYKHINVARAMTTGRYALLCLFVADTMVLIRGLSWGQLSCAIDYEWLLLLRRVPSVQILSYRIAIWLTHCGLGRPFGSTLVQIMTCCLTAPFHYLSHCWLIMKAVLWHPHESSFTVRAMDCIGNTRSEITLLNILPYILGSMS